MSIFNFVIFEVDMAGPMCYYEASCYREKIDI